MIQLVHVDAFAHRDFFGNPLAVVLVPTLEHFDSATMQRIASWLNLSETTFVECAERSSSYTLRIFTPKQELPFAGHPSIGTAAALSALGLLHSSTSRYTQHCAAGALAVWSEQQGELTNWFVQAPDAQIRPLGAAQKRELEVICDARAARCGQAPAVVDNGPKWAVVEFEDAAELLAAKPDFDALGIWNTAHDNIGLAAFARAEDALGAYLEVRCFVPLDGIDEDPVTGSGNAAIASYLHASNGFADASTPALGRDYRARQGRAIGRDGHLRLRVESDGRVAVGGPVRVIARGELSLG